MQRRQEWEAAIEAAMHQYNNTVVQAQAKKTNNNIVVQAQAKKTRHQSVAVQAQAKKPTSSRRTSTSKEADIKKEVSSYQHKRRRRHHGSTLPITKHGSTLSITKEESISVVPTKHKRCISVVPTKQKRIISVVPTKQKEKQASYPRSKYKKQKFQEWITKRTTLKQEHKSCEKNPSSPTLLRTRLPLTWADGRSVLEYVDGLNGWQTDLLASEPLKQHAAAADSRASNKAHFYS